MKNTIGACLLGLGLAGGAFAQQAGVLPATGPLTRNTVQRLLLTDAARAGNRLVAVGDRGYVVASEDHGLTWQRANSPATALLTAIEFADATHGWAVGHDSVILATADGGATWAQQFSAPKEERPLLDVLFLDAKVGFAAGAYGAFYETADGGKTWTPRKVLEDDKHLNALVRFGEGRIMVLGEAGTILVSSDAGKTFAPVPSPYRGSFFGGIANEDGSVVVFGLRGRIYRTADAGKTWQQVENASVASLMGGSRLADGSLVIAGAAGTALISRDQGRTFARLDSGTTRAFAKAVPGAPNSVLLLGEAGARDVLLSSAPR